MRGVLSFVIIGFSLIVFGFAFLALEGATTGYMVVTPSPVIPSASVISGVLALMVGSYRLNKVSDKGTKDFLAQVKDYKEAHKVVEKMRLDHAMNDVMKVLVDGALTHDYKKISVFHEFEDTLSRKIACEKNPIFLQRSIITMGNAISVIKSMQNFDQKQVKNLEVMHGTAKTFLLNLYKQQNRLE